MILKYKEFFNYLIEGLIKTYPIKTTIKLIKKELGGLEYRIDSDEGTNTIFLKLLSKDINLDKLISFYRTVNLCGYFISNYDFYNSSDNVIGYLIHNDNLNQKFTDELIHKINNSYFIQINIKIFQD